MVKTKSVREERSGLMEISSSRLLKQPDKDKNMETTASILQANQEGIQTARIVGYWHCHGEEKARADGWLVREIPLAIFVNGQEWVTLMCSPHRLPPLVVGFLFSEQIIGTTDDIAYMRVCEEDMLAEVKLNSNVTLPTRRVLSSGCGGGVGFRSSLADLPTLNCNLVVESAQVTALAKVLAQVAKVSRLCGGTHMSALCDGEKLLVLAEDIGRHNTIDRIKGECLLQGIPTQNRIIVTSGRISSDMVVKAGRMAVPLLISRTTPTDQAVALAERIGVTVVGYVRGTTMRVYSHAYRIKDCFACTNNHTVVDAGNLEPI